MKHALSRIAILFVVFVVFCVGLCCSWLISGRPIKMQTINKEITLTLPYGERAGTYTGGVSKGIPDGNGRFTSTNASGISWTYRGDFRNGVFDGKGTMTWSTGYTEKGTYTNGVMTKGSEIDAYGNVLYEGVFDADGTHHDNFLKQAIRQRLFKKNYIIADWSDITTGALLGEAVRLEATVKYLYLSEGGAVVDYFLAIDGEATQLLVGTYEPVAEEDLLAVGSTVYVWGYLERLEYETLYEGRAQMPQIYVVAITEHKRDGSDTVYSTDEDIYSADADIYSAGKDTAPATTP